MPSRASALDAGRLTPHRAEDERSLPIACTGWPSSHLKVVVVQPSAGEFKAYSATCTHQGCAVKSVSDGLINCPCHNSNFSVADGSVSSGPATKPLPEVRITVDGDSITLA